MDELLAFGRTYPEYQQIFRIIALGSAWVDSRGFRYVGYLDGHASWRGLDLCDSESAWGKKDRFLAVRKWVDLKPEGATLTIGGRVYEPLSVLRGGEKKVHGPVVVERAKEMHANFGKEEGEHLLKHQGDIPVELRNSVVFVFVDWRHPKEFEKVCCISWSKNLQCWTKDWIWLDDSWLGVCRVLRRVS